jgi:integrating conjugative element membrane protein (TIGR03745 family)
MSNLRELRVSKRKLMVKPVAKAMLGAALVMAAGVVAAQGIPVVELPPEATTGGWLVTARWLIGAGLLVSAIALAGFAMLKVGGSIIGAYGDVTTGRKTVGDVAGIATLGLVVLVLVISLVAAAVRISPVNF